MKRGKRHTKQIILLLLSIEILIIISGVAYLRFTPMVVKAVTMEAGTPMVEVDKFLLKNWSGNYITELSTLELRNPGTYEVKIKIGNRINTSSLEVIDTLPPKAKAVNHMVLMGEILEAKAFVMDISDSTEVSVNYQEMPDFTLTGDQEVTILLSDTSNNLTKLTATLTVLDIKSSVTIEAGAAMDIAVEDFVDHDNYKAVFITDMAKLDISRPITYEIQLSVNGKIVTSKIEVIDTTPPTADITNLETWYGDELPAASFTSNRKDATAVTVSYQITPDFKLPGNQDIVLLLEDENGNRTALPAVLTVIADTEAPVISGVADKSVYIGDTISYKKGITVSDNRGEVSLQVDSSNVNLKSEGIYPIQYIATDLSGNITTVSANVTVKKIIISEATVYEVADGILAKIITEGMTKREKALEIYRWVKNHVGYTGSSDKSDWLFEAYRGMKNGVGDCFTFYAVSQALLTRAGIDNMRVTRVGGRTQHFWNLVNCGAGWYHFDTCPHVDDHEAFMLTDAEVAAYTAKKGNHYYSFDKSLYPATPEK